MSTFKPGQTVIALKDMEDVLTKGHKYVVQGKLGHMFIKNNRGVSNYFGGWEEEYFAVSFTDTPNTNDAGEQLLSTEETPFQKNDTGKPLVSLIEPSFILGIASVLTMGANKYALSLIHI